MLQVIEGPTIQAGESLSDSVDCSAGQLVRITIPEGWTDAVMTFQFSTDGMFFNDMYGVDGFAVTIPEVVPRAGVVVPGVIGRAVAYLKIRSGTPGNPVVQEEARTFAVAILTPDQVEIVEEGR